MRTSSILISCVGNAIYANAAAIEARQANSALAASVFMRRGYQSSAVLNGWVYIDGGEFSYNSNGDTALQYSSTLLAIDLSSDWSNQSVSIHSSSKPAAVPNLNRGGVWVDEGNKVLYTGFAGYKSGYGDGANQTRGLWQFKPDNSGSGTWTNLNSTADAALQTQNRPESPLVASGGGAGYMLGGFIRLPTSTEETLYTLGGLISYDYSGKKVSNSTVSVYNGGKNDFGALTYVPHFGNKGVLVAFGGSQLGKVTAGVDALVSFTTIQIYDIDSGNWYEQATTGDVPSERKEFCYAGIASTNKTFDILVYAGWNGQLGAASIPFDEAFVLTLPGFHWVRASSGAQHPRHGLTCNAVGGSQILTIGGLDTTQSTQPLYDGPFKTKDPAAQGLQIFDMTTLAFTSGYKASAGAYVQSNGIQGFYSSNSRMPTFTDSGLQSVFSIQNFTAASTTSGSPSATASGNTPASSSTDTGTIVGGVVGGCVGLAAIGGLAWLCMRRRHSHKTAEHVPLAIHEASPDAELRRYEKDAGDDYCAKPPAAVEMHSGRTLAELPDQDQAPVELPSEPAPRYHH